MDHVAIEQERGQTEVLWKYPNGKPFRCKSPSQAIVLVDDVESITPDTLAQWCQERLRALFPQEVKGLSLKFIPEEVNGAYYHYTHGLHQHDGNCQRIAHGHRSRIEIFINGQRDAALEAEWANRWQDIYIGTSAHRQESDAEVSSYAYQAPQGDFFLSLPTEYCYDIKTETTVEQIARHLAARIKQVRPLDEVLVRAYEGIGKGAVSEA